MIHIRKSVLAINVCLCHCFVIVFVCTDFLMPKPVNPSTVMDVAIVELHTIFQTFYVCISHRGLVIQFRWQVARCAYFYKGAISKKNQMVQHNAATCSATNMRCTIQSCRLHPKTGHALVITSGFLWDLIIFPLCQLQTAIWVSNCPA